MGGLSTPYRQPQFNTIKTKNEPPVPGILISMILLVGSRILRTRQPRREWHPRNGAYTCSEGKRSVGYSAVTAQSTADTQKPRTFAAPLSSCRRTGSDGD